MAKRINKENEQENTQIIENVEAKAETKTVKNRVKIERDMEVKVMNLCSNSFHHLDEKTGSYYCMQEYGDFEYMTVDEIIRMKNKFSKVFNEFWIMIVDVENDEIELEDVLKYVQLDKLYKDMPKPEVIDNMILGDSFEKFEKMLNSMNKVMVNKVTERSVELFRDKKFSDRWKMDTLEKLLDKPHLFEDIKKSIE